MTAREVYPSAPVALVALEVRHPHAPLDSRGPAWAQVKKILSPVTQIAGESHATTLMLGPGMPNQQTETSPRFSSRDRSTAVTFRSTSVVVETTKYERYERLREIIELALEARQAAGGVDGVQRIGLRYFDEIGAPGVDRALDWSVWLDPSLIGPAPLAAAHGLSAAQWQGVTVFEGQSPGTAVVLRYGPGDGYAVDPGGELRRPAPAPGPYFLLDIDSYWAPEDVPPFDLKELLATCDELHRPVRDLFESLITEKLKKEVLRRVG